MFKQNVNAREPLTLCIFLDCVCWYGRLEPELPAGYYVDFANNLNHVTLPADGTPNTEFFTLAKVLDVNNQCRFLIDAKTVYKDVTETPDRPKMQYLRFFWGYLTGQSRNDFRYHGYRLRVGVGNTIVTITNFTVGGSPADITPEFSRKFGVNVFKLLNAETFL